MFSTYSSSQNDVSYYHTHQVRFQRDLSFLFSKEFFVAVGVSSLIAIVSSVHRASRSWRQRTITSNMSKLLAVKTRASRTTALLRHLVGKI